MSDEACLPQDPGEAQKSVGDQVEKQQRNQKQELVELEVEVKAPLVARLAALEFDLH